jgi:hypothetical protein
MSFLEQYNVLGDPEFGLILSVGKVGSVSIRDTKMVRKYQPQQLHKEVSQGGAAAQPPITPSTVDLTP